LYERSEDSMDGAVAFMNYMNQRQQMAQEAASSSTNSLLNFASTNIANETKKAQALSNFIAKQQKMKQDQENFEKEYNLKKNAVDKDANKEFADFREDYEKNTNVSKIGQLIEVDNSIIQSYKNLDPKELENFQKFLKDNIKLSYDAKTNTWKLPQFSLFGTAKGGWKTASIKSPDSLSDITDSLNAYISAAENEGKFSQEFLNSIRDIVQNQKLRIGILGTESGFKPSVAMLRLFSSGAITNILSDPEGGIEFYENEMKDHFKALQKKVAAEFKLGDSSLTLSLNPRYNIFKELQSQGLHKHRKTIYPSSQNQSNSSQFVNADNPIIQGAENGKDFIGATK